MNWTPSFRLFVPKHKFQSEVTTIVLLALEQLNYGTPCLPTLHSWNLFKIGLSTFLERIQDVPVNENCSLSWRRTHVLQMSWARSAKPTTKYVQLTPSCLALARSYDNEKDMHVLLRRLSQILVVFVRRL